VGGAAARASVIARLRGGGGRAERREPEGEGAPARCRGRVPGTPLYNAFRGIPDYRSMSLMRYEPARSGTTSWTTGRLVAARAGPRPNPDPDRERVRLGGQRLAAPLAPVSKELRKAPGGLVARAFRLVVPSPHHRSVPDPRCGRREGGRPGLTTGDIVSIVSRPRNGGVAVADPIAVAAILVPELRKQADMVVALTHIGVDEDRALARRVPGST